VLYFARESKIYISYGLQSRWVSKLTNGQTSRERLKSSFCHPFFSSKVASSHGDHNINVTDLRTNKCISTLTGHPRTPWCIAFHPHRNDILASGCLGGQVRVWDLSVRSFYFLKLSHFSFVHENCSLPST
jgi:activator-of-BECN1-regulated-autophagy protein 1